ncbi:MAG TPA: MFS transporter [Thermoplasmata archaeon]
MGEDPERIRSRVRRYYAFQVLVAFQLWSPFWTLWLFAHADYFQATLVDVAFWIVSLLVAIPAGAIADRYGRKRAMVLGVVIWVLGIVLFGLATTVVGFAIANGVWAFGAGFLWGAGSAYLYDTLLEVRLEARYPALSGRVEMYAFLGTALASVMGGAVVATSGRFDLPLILYGLVGVGALGLALTFQEPTVPREPASNLVAQIRGGLRTTAGNRQIVLIIMFQVLVGLVTYVMAFFRPRFIDDVVEGNYLLMGAVYAGFFCVAAFAGLTVGRLLDRFGESGALVLVFLLVFPPFVLVFAVSEGFFAPVLALVLGVLTQACFYFVWGVEGPVVTTIVNRRVASGDRATVLAISSFFSTLVIAIGEPVIGLVATDYDIGVGLAGLALAASLPTAYVLVAYRRSVTRPAAPVAGPVLARGR